MDKKTSVELISEKIRQELTISINQKIKLKIKLIPIIDKIKKLHKIDFEISPDEIIDQLNKDNKKHHVDIEISIKNQIHFIYFKEYDISIDPLEYKDESKDFLLENHIFSVMSLSYLIFILNVISSIITNKVFFVGIDIIHIITLFIIGILYIFNKNFKTLFFCFSSVVFLNFENGFIASTISTVVTILFLSRIKPLKNILVIPVTIVIFASFSILGIFLFEQITISSIIINNILIISVIITMFFAYNNYNLLGYIFFIATSMTLYHILCDIIIFLNERAILFYPYNDKLHIEIYLFSFLLTMLFFSLDVFIIIIEQTIQTSTNIYSKLKKHMLFFATSALSLMIIITIFIYNLLKIYLGSYIDNEEYNYYEIISLVLISLLTSVSTLTLIIMFVIPIFLLAIPNKYKNSFKNANINKIIVFLVNFKNSLTINFNQKLPQEKTEKESSYNQYFKIYGKLNNKNLSQNVLILTVIYLLIFSNIMYGTPEYHFYRDVKNECDNISENTYISKIYKENKILTLNYQLKEHLKIQHQYTNKFNKIIYIYEEDCNKVNKIN